jgi:hypothetical protein
MRIGLIDVDGHNYPNLPLMKLSAWHKAQGDSVEWYDHSFDYYVTHWMPLPEPPERRMIWTSSNK